MLCCLVCVCFFFFKQKTAYEMRISDWSSDVCSSDLHFGKVVTHRTAQLRGAERCGGDGPAEPASKQVAAFPDHLDRRGPGVRQADQIGRASCRARVCQYV